MKKLIVSLSVAAFVLLAVPAVVLADGEQKCVGQYGQTVDCGPVTSPTPHTPVQAGIGDFINPLTLGVASVSAAGIFSLLNKRKAI